MIHASCCRTKSTRARICSHPFVKKASSWTQRHTVESEALRQRVSEKCATHFLARPIYNTPASYSQIGMRPRMRADDDIVKIALVAFGPLGIYNSTVPWESPMPYSKLPVELSTGSSPRVFPAKDKSAHQRR